MPSESRAPCWGRLKPARRGPGAQASTARPCTLAPGAAGREVALGSHGWCVSGLTGPHTSDPTLDHTVGAALGTPQALATRRSRHFLLTEQLCVQFGPGASILWGRGGGRHRHRGRAGSESSRCLSGYDADVGRWHRHCHQPAQATGFLGSPAIKARRQGRGQEERGALAGSSSSRDPGRRRLRERSWAQVQTVAP